MFERFTDKARRVVVRAQEEARRLNHNYIGSEHILLAITAGQDSVAAKALESLDISLDRVRTDLLQKVPRGQQGPSGHIPFTPAAKKTLELSLREALQLGHNHIGSEHILLGLIREGEGIAAQVLAQLGADLDRTRGKVIEVLSGPFREGGPAPGFVGDAPPRSDLAVELVPAPMLSPPLPFGGPFAACSFCGRDLWDTGRYVSGSSAVICDVCIEAARRAVAEAPEGENALTLPPRVFGEPPDDNSVRAIDHAVCVGLGGGPDDEWVASVEDGAALVHLRPQVQARIPHLTPTTVRVDRIRFRTRDLADVRCTISLGVGPAAPRMPVEGSVVRREGRWVVSRETYCAAIQRAGVQCPPREDAP